MINKERTEKESLFKSIFVLHAGPSIPLSEFADNETDNQTAGGAGVGLDIGIHYVNQLLPEGLGLFGGIERTERFSGTDGADCH